MPTYLLGKDIRGEKDFEFTDPPAAIAVSQDEGVALKLAKDGQVIRNDDCQSIHVERRPLGWAIFLNNPTGTDAVIYFTDDGKIRVLPENLQADVAMVQKQYRGVDLPDED